MMMMMMMMMMMESSRYFWIKIHVVISRMQSVQVITLDVSAINSPLQLTFIFNIKKEVICVLFCYLYGIKLSLDICKTLYLSMLSKELLNKPSNCSHRHAII